MYATRVIMKVFFPFQTEKKKRRLRASKTLRIDATRHARVSIHSNRTFCNDNC